MTELQVVLCTLSLNRDRKGYQIASKLGVAPETWSRYKNGRKIPQPETLWRIGEVFELELEEMLELQFKGVLARLQKARFIEKGPKTWKFTIQRS